MNSEPSGAPALWLGALIVVGLAGTANWNPATSADGDGNFAIDGVGLVTCQRFVEERAETGASYQRILGWIEGYFSGVNQFSPETFDASPWQSSELLAAIIDSFCRDNLDRRLHEALQLLASELMDDRLQQASEGIVLRDETGRAVGIYVAVLRRAQAKLRDLGFYDDEPDGLFGPKTAEAITSFQISQELEPTGLPDPGTLWWLFQP